MQAQYQINLYYESWRNLLDIRLPVGILRPIGGYADSPIVRPIIKIINFNLILFLNKKSLATGTPDSEGGLKPELI
jgi:hypothetical protein